MRVQVHDQSAAPNQAAQWRAGGRSMENESVRRTEYCLKVSPSNACNLPAELMACCRYRPWEMVLVVYGFVTKVSSQCLPYVLSTGSGLSQALCLNNYFSSNTGASPAV